jgi:hypothetical protein
MNHGCCNILITVSDVVLLVPRAADILCDQGYSVQ